MPAFERELRTNMQRLIVYAQSSDASLQRMVAERIANECVREDRRRLIVELDGLALLLPLARARCAETRRMAAHALANLSVETENQRALVERAMAADAPGLGVGPAGDGAPMPGAAPWPPLPVMVMVIRSAAAIMGPRLTPTVPGGMDGQLCMA